MFDKAAGLKEAAAVKTADLVAVSGQAAFLSHAVWWSELCFTAILLLSRMLTGLRAQTGTLLAAPFNPLLSAHFWSTAGAGTIVLTALSSSVREGNYTQKWNGSACRRKLVQTPRARSFTRVHFGDRCAWIGAHLWLRVFLWERMLIRWSLPLEYYFYSSLWTIVSTTSLCASIPSGPTAGLSVVSFPSDWPWL